MPFNLLLSIMVHQTKLQEPEVGLNITNQNTNLNHLSHHQHSTNNMKHPRQFSTRSRAKSTASFKGLRRALGHDMSKSIDRTHHHHQQLHHNSSNPVARIKSADSLYRRRTSSGLNMTSLRISGSHHNALIPTTLPSGSYSHSGSHLFGHTSVGIRPRRTKSTHSVLQDGEEKSDSDFNNIDNSEEEVDYFTDEELITNKESDSMTITTSENLDHGVHMDTTQLINVHSATQNNNIVPKPLSKKPQFTLGNDHENLDNSLQSDDSDEEELQVKKESKEIDKTKSYLDTVNLNKEDSLIKLRNETEYHSTLDNVSIDGMDSLVHKNHTKVDRMDIISNHITSQNNQLVSDSEDHIGVAESVGTVTSNELTRQVRNQKQAVSNSNNTAYIEYNLQRDDIISTQKDFIVDNENEDHRDHANKFNINGSSGKEDFENSNIDKNIPSCSINNSLAGHYIPTMILSQSTGIERTFEHPASIQNSLSNELHTTIRNKDNANNEKNANINIQLMHNNKQNIEINSNDEVMTNSIEQPDVILKESNALKENSFQKKSDEHMQSNIQNSPQQTENKNKRNSFSNSYSSLTNNLQRANAAASLTMTANAKNNSSKLKNKKDTTSIIHENSSKPSSYISTIFNRRPNSRQQQYLKQERRGSMEKNAPSLLSQLSNTNRRTSITENKVNMNDNFSNFSQFLKTDNTNDGDLRTQRKLWLQRENSIMDLNLQKDSNADSIFMATNVDVKREFERISHEYTSLRRFYNTIDAALERFESNKGQIQSTVNKTSTNANIKSHSRKHTSNNEITQSLVSQGDSMLNAFINGRSATSKVSENNLKADDFFGNTQNSKLQRILTTMWNQESANFNNEVNPLSTKNSGRTAANENNTNTNAGLHQTYHNTDIHQSSTLAARHSLRNAVGSSTNFYRQ